MSHAMNAIQCPGVPGRQAIQSLTVADIDAAQGVEEHAAMVRSWAAQMWQAWSVHHATVRACASGKA